MVSMIGIMMAVSLFFGSFALCPVSRHEIRSGELKFKAETRLNEPLDARLSDMPLDNLSAEFDIKYKTSGDLKKLEVQWDMLLSNGVDKPEQISCWGNMDYSDRNIPKTLFIFKYQDDEKYHVINIQHPVASRVTALTMIPQFISGDMISSVNKNIADGLNGKNVNITEQNGLFSAVLDEAALKEVIKQIALGTGDYIAPYLGDNIAAPDAIKSQFKIAINDFFAKLENVQVFEKDALVLTMTADDKNQPKNINYAININTNLSDLTKAFDGDLNGSLPGENSSIDMTVIFDYTYNKVNEEVIIDYPKLTGENSVDITGGTALPGIDVNTVNVVVNNHLTPLSHKPFIRGGTIYLPLRESLNLKGVGNEYIVWDNGTIDVKAPNLSATLKIDSDEIKRDEQTLNAEAKVLLLDDTTYIPVSVFGELGLGGMTNTFYDENNNIIGCVISLYQYTVRENKGISFLVPDSEPVWEEYLYKAGDMTGARIKVDTTSAENYLEKTNLVIAAGEASVMIGKYSDDYIKKMTETDAIYPAFTVNDEYRIIIPKIMENADVAMEIAKHFVSLVNQK
jgi:hypothetical protein